MNEPRAAIDSIAAPILVEADLVGFFVDGDPRDPSTRCQRCGDVNYEEDTRLCLTCTYPDDPCSAVYWEQWATSPD